MTSPGGIFGEMERLTGVIDIDDLVEKRFENDVDENPIYIGYTLTPDADPDALIWYIIKVEYVGQGVVRQRLPMNGLGFIYSWTDRATYFP